MHLGPDARGRRFGMTFAETFAQTWLPIFPPALAAVVIRCMLRGWPPGLDSVASCVPCALPHNVPIGVPVLVGFGSLLGSAALAYSLVPSGVRSLLVSFLIVTINYSIALRRCQAVCASCQRVAVIGFSLASEHADTS